MASAFVRLLSSNLTGIVLSSILIGGSYLLAGTRNRRFRNRRPDQF